MQLSAYFINNFKDCLLDNKHHICRYLKYGINNL